MKEFRIVERIPTVEEYNRLRAIVGWHQIPSDRAVKGLNESLYSICIEKDEELVAFGRVVGDGHIYFYVQDVIVLSDYQNSGLGSKVMDHLMEFITSRAPKKTGAYVGLMISPGLESFYEKYGFSLLPEDSPAMGLWRNGH